MIEIEHTPACIAGQKLEREWLEQWGKTYCKTCHGFGQSTSTYDPSPAGVSLGSGYMVDIEPCKACTCNGICPRCGERGLTLEDDPDSDGVVGRGPCTGCGWDYKIGGRPEYPCSCEEDYFNKREEAYARSLQGEKA